MPGTNDNPTDEMMIWLDVERRGTDRDQAGDGHHRLGQLGSLPRHDDLERLLLRPDAERHQRGRQHQGLHRRPGSRGWMSSSKYITSVQSGTEVFTGTGELDTTGYYCRNSIVSHFLTGAVMNTKSRLVLGVSALALLLAAGVRAEWNSGASGSRRLSSSSGGKGGQLGRRTPARAVRARRAAWETVGRARHVERREHRVGRREHVERREHRVGRLEHSSGRRRPPGRAVRARRAAGTPAGGTATGTGGAAGAPVMKECATKTTIMTAVFMNFEDYKGTTDPSMYATAFGSTTVGVGTAYAGTLPYPEADGAHGADTLPRRRATPRARGRRPRPCPPRCGGWAAASGWAAPTPRHTRGSRSGCAARRGRAPSRSPSRWTAPTCRIR